MATSPPFLERIKQPPFLSLSLKRGGLSELGLSGDERKGEGEGISAPVTLSFKRDRFPPSFSDCGFLGGLDISRYVQYYVVLHTFSRPKKRERGGNGLPRCPFPSIHHRGKEKVHKNPIIIIGAALLFPPLPLRTLNREWED